MYDDEIDISSKAELRQVFTQRLGGGTLDEAQSRFIAQIADDLAALLARFWRFATQADGPEVRFQLTGALGADGRELELEVLEIVQPDTPFLVDSVMGALAAGGYDVRAMFHPVVAMAEAAAPVSPAPASERSLILVVLGPVGEDRRAALLEEIGRTLRDVHAAVADFPALRAMADRAAADLAASAAPFSACRA